MDLQRTIQYLYEQKAKVERAIASLEELQKAAPVEVSQAIGAQSRRGRKFMGAEERQEVAERMRKYWAGRRAGTEDTPEADVSGSG